MVGKLPPIDKKIDIIINFKIPNVTHFLWKMWHDELPEFNNDIMSLCPYILALYVGCSYDPYDFYVDKRGYAYGLQHNMDIRRLSEQRSHDWDAMRKYEKL
jgi:hypothetical protein